MDKLALKTEPVSHDNMILVLKPGYQTSLVLYSTDNHIWILEAGSRMKQNP